MILMMAIKSVENGSVHVQLEWWPNGHHPTWLRDHQITWSHSDFFDHAEWRVGERSVSPTVGIAAIAKATFRDKPPLEAS